MKFRTEYISTKASFQLDPRLPVVLMGSCFSQNIAGKMNDHLWENSFSGGTLYNPVSIETALDLLMDEENGKEKFERSLFYFNGLWHSRLFDSSFSSIHQEDCIHGFLIKQNEFLQAINKGKILIVTFGSSICYHQQTDGLIVGNCHKLPSENFYRKRMSTEEITIRWTNLIDNLKQSFPGIKIIFTVSPVRHLKDGFEGNMRSKAVLLLATEAICLKNDSCFYFPAFEILYDDLRDYRFYASDLAHPSEEAINYIWEKFTETYLGKEGMLLLREGANKKRASMHRPLVGALGKPLSI